MNAITTNVLPFEKPTFDIEATLQKMKKLNAKIKALTAEFSMLKEQAIKEYFSDCDTYTTAKGLILATYKEIISNRFDSAEFKKNHALYYATFSKPHSSYRFDLK